MNDNKVTTLGIAKRLLDYNQHSPTIYFPLLVSECRRGKWHDNAFAESFFQLLKRERIKRKIYISRDAARADVFYKNHRRTVLMAICRR
ncbi:transposase subunit B [Alcanivorax sp. 521-1]|uniref:Transposase subunit B n=1 Tax=Alloalcanivorax profundimaris TaxID=2735259 RepID=A0ABS0AVZ8_9GAMM|nr:transposase subunit B [Alloalcanivorax profundimaris]